MLDHFKSSARSLTSFVTFRMSRTQNKLNAQANFLLKSQSDLSLVEWRVIQLLKLFDGASMSKLSAEVQIDKGQLSRKINTMVAKGLIVAKPDARDHRKQNLHLTPKAKAVSDAIMPLMQKRQALLLAGVSEAELETFFKVLAVIDQAADERDIS